MEQLKKSEVMNFEMNERHYSCVKIKKGNEIQYIFFSPELYETQIKIKERKFERQKKKGNKLLKKRKVQKIPSDTGWVELIPHLQKTLSAIDNPYITGVEGFFILESSVDDEPERILKLYKERDKAEKFIRALKEGLELRPVRHWSKWAIIDIFFFSFLTNFLINLTLTTVYPLDRLKFSVLSNVSPQILSILGDFVWNFEDKSLSLRW